MKKIFIYASAVGLAAGVIYLLYKKEKSGENATSKTVNKVEVKVEPKSQMQNMPQREQVEDEMFHAKSESVQDVYERHSEAAEIMKDAYQNVMEDFVEDFSNEEVTTEKEIVIDGESVSVINELDAISDELDDLLK